MIPIRPITLTPVSMILRSGWAPARCPHSLSLADTAGVTTISTVEQAIGHRCGNPKSCALVAHGVCGLCPQERRPLHLVLYVVSGGLCGLFAVLTC